MITKLVLVYRTTIKIDVRGEGESLVIFNDKFSL